MSDVSELASQGSKCHLCEGDAPAQRLDAEDLTSIGQPGRDFVTKQEHSASHSTPKECQPLGSCAQTWSFEAVRLNARYRLHFLQCPLFRVSTFNLRNWRFLSGVEMQDTATLAARSVTPREPGPGECSAF